MFYKIILVLFVIPSCVFSLDELHQRCSGPFSCGDQEALLYPFWKSERENCGHPDFKLDCSGGFAEMNISSLKFRILSMSFDPPVIRLARSDYIGNLCPPNPRNASFSGSVLQLVQDTDLLTLYYECNFLLHPASAISYIGVFGCSYTYQTFTTNYYVTRTLSSPLLEGISDLLYNFTTLCSRNVSVPVSRYALEELEESPSEDNLDKALDHGFKLGFSPDCSQCLKSGGSCGYNQTLSSFVCYCEDKTHSLACKKRGEISFEHVLTFKYSSQYPPLFPS